MRTRPKVATNSPVHWPTPAGFRRELQDRQVEHQVHGEGAEHAGGELDGDVGSGAARGDLPAQGGGGLGTAHLHEALYAVFLRYGSEAICPVQGRP